MQSPSNNPWPREGGGIGTLVPITFQSSLTIGNTDSDPTDQRASAAALQQTSPPPLPCELQLHVYVAFPVEPLSSSAASYILPPLRILAADIDIESVSFDI